MCASSPQRRLKSLHASAGRPQQKLAALHSAIHSRPFNMAESGHNNGKKRGRTYDAPEDDELTLLSVGEPSSKRSAHVSFADTHGLSLDASNTQEEDEFMAFGLGEEMEDEEANAQAKARSSGIQSDFIGKSLAQIITHDGRKSASRAKSSAAANKAAPGGAQLPTVRASRPAAAVDIDPALNLYNNEEPAAPAIQVTVGADGRIIINQESQMLQQIQTPDVVRTEVEGGQRHITSATYAKRPRGDKWKFEDVELLYHAISLCGTDFSMVEVFFPTRTRAQVKARFKKEEKTCPDRIERAIAARAPINVGEFKELIALKKLFTTDPEAYEVARLAKQEGRPYQLPQAATAPQTPAPDAAATQSSAPQTPAPAAPAEAPSSPRPSAYTEDDDTLLAGPAPPASAPVEEANEEATAETVQAPAADDEPSLSTAKEPEDEEEEDLFKI